MKYADKLSLGLATGIAVLLCIIQTAKFHRTPPIPTGSKEFSGDRAYALLRTITTNYPDRLWGSEGVGDAYLFLEQYVLDLQSQFGVGRVEYELQNETILGDPRVIWAGFDPTSPFISGPQTTGGGAVADCETAGGFIERPCFVYNLNVLVKGVGITPPDRTLMISSHLDAVRGSPGASDDGSGTVAALELMRAVAALELEHDVLFTISDGEEQGIYGAGIFRLNSTYRDVPSACIVLEAGGAAVARAFIGRANSAELVKALQKYAPQPAAYSFVNWLENVLSIGYTDSSIHMRSGIQCIDLNFLDDRWAYHTSEDSLEKVTPGALQQIGGNALGMIVGMIESNTVPRRFQPGEDPFAGILNNFLFTDDEPVANSGLVYMSLFDTSVWIFASQTEATAVLITCAVVFSLISFGLTVSIGKTRVKVVLNYALGRDLPLVFWTFVFGFALPFVAHFAAVDWKAATTWHIEGKHQARILLGVLSSIFSYVLLVRFFVLKLLGKCGRGESSMDVHGKVDASVLHDKAGETESEELTEQVKNWSLDLYLSVAVFQAILLIGMSAALVDFAQVFFWAPFFMMVGLVWQVLLERYTSVDELYVLAGRDIISIFLPILMIFDIWSMLINLFPYYLQELDFAFVIPGIIGLPVGLSMLLALPLMVRVSPTGLNKFAIFWGVCLAIVIIAVFAV